MRAASRGVSHWATEVESERKPRGVMQPFTVSLSPRWNHRTGLDFTGKETDSAAMFFSNTSWEDPLGAGYPAGTNANKRITMTPAARIRDTPA